MFVYDIDSYFDYDYSGPNLTGLRGTQIMGSISYTLVRGRAPPIAKVHYMDHLSYFTKYKK
jgi:hypothetical protein